MKKFHQSYYDNLRVDGKKYCPQCKNIYDIELFRSGLCIPCRRLLHKREYANNKEKYADRYNKKSKPDDYYYVYKFVDKNNQVVYVGKTKRLAARMIQHFRTDGHLSDDCYDDVASVFYCQLNTKIEMDIYELYYIDKYRPNYNVMGIYESNEISNIILPCVEWHDYHFKVAI